ncbi:MAG TPA: oligopeptide transporter, OPT family [Sumerlaeia bacterium]|nr:oligopeptide transporter, OPT family [Sumerlaeia bacterium]
MSATHTPAEITIGSVLLGVLLSVVLAGANAYLGLFAGMTVSASIPAAVVSMGVFRILRRGNILQNNIVQTAASAGESLAAGVIFTMPALVLLDFWTDFNYFWVTVISMFGGILGVLFTIPLRRSLILESDLKFPEGIAAAEVLKSGERGGADVVYIAKAAVAGGLFKFGETGLRLWAGAFEAARGVGGSILYFGANLSPALLAVGYIVGLNIAVLVFLGGASNWLIAIPVHAAFNEWPTKNGIALPALDAAYEIWSTKTRYIGVGGMLAGGLWTVFRLRKSLLSGIRSGMAAYGGARGEAPDVPPTERDIPMKWVLLLMVWSVAPLFLVYQVFVGRVAVSLTMAITMVALGFLFAAVASYMAGLVGSSNNPTSGVTIATVVVASVLLALLMGKDAVNGPAAAIIVGSAVCCAVAIGGDNMQDLKTGYLVGATPWKQQVMQIVGVVSAAFVLAPILTLLLKAYGFQGHSSAMANPLAAPQANLMASVARGVFHGDLPWNYVSIGAVLAVAVIALDVCLERRGAAFRTPVLAVAVGVYLPLQLAVPIFAGGLLHSALRSLHKRKGHSKDRVESSDRRGLLFASGLITGEALLGILMAIPIVLSGDPDVLVAWRGPAIGLILVVGIGCWLYTAACGKEGDETSS